MNPIQELEDQLNKKIKGIECKPDKPLNDSDLWILDVFYNNKHINVCWQEGKVFGLSHRDDAAYGEGCDEIYDEMWDVYTRIIELYGFCDVD